MNLRGLVRGAINSVNNDKLIQWLASTGSTFGAAGTLTPTYAAVQSIYAQIQPVPTDRLAQLENLNIQGVMRSVYMRNGVASAVRADGTGGDLLQFPEVLNGLPRTWLVVTVEEAWDNWCHVIVKMQNDMNNAPWTSDSSVPSDSGLTS